MRMRFVGLGILVLVLAACAAPKPRPAADNRVDPNFKPPPAGALIVLLPEPQTPPIEAGEVFMARQLEQQLMSAGYRVAKLSRSNYAEIWPQEVASVGGLFDAATGAPRPQAYGVALSRLARRVCEELKCALLVQQRLLKRSAQLDGSVAEWDGQRLPIPVKDIPGREARFSGSAPGLSVELFAMTAEGRLGFRTYGGATLPYRTNMQESKNELRQTLFADDREVADAVRIALEPLRPGKAD